MADEDIKEARKEMEDTVIEGLATHIEAMHNASDLREEGVWTGCGPIDTAQLSAWSTTSMPKLARIQVDFWRGVFELYRDQAQKVATELRGQAQRRRRSVGKVHRVHLHPTDDNWWVTKGAAVRIRNPGGACLTLTPESQVVALFDATGALWKGTLEASLTYSDETHEATVTLSLLQSQGAPGPLHGQVELAVGLSGAAPEQALKYTLHLTCQAS